MKKRAIELGLALLLLFWSAVPAWALPKTLIPGGRTVGMKLYSQGPVITGFTKESAARAAGLKEGDMIIRVDGMSTETAAVLRKNLEQEQVVLTVIRRGREAEFCVRPRENKLGAYVRDSLAGIGTVTYYDPETGEFGALGHGVSDVETQQLLPADSGVVVPSSVEQVKKGRRGDPGALKGIFDTNRVLGEITKNSHSGVFGSLTVPVEGTPVAVGTKEQVKPGSARILSNVDGTAVQAYSVEILKIYPHGDEAGRDLLLQITDPELLETTGGIVQGMSGSPIIQDGKLVGAVTHVLVNDPTTGYGIFIENMLGKAE